MHSVSNFNQWDVMFSIIQLIFPRTSYPGLNLQKHLQVRGWVLVTSGGGIGGIIQIENALILSPANNPQCSH